MSRSKSEAKIILREIRFELLPGRGMNGGKQLKVTFIHLGLKKRKRQKKNNEPAMNPIIFHELTL